MKSNHLTFLLGILLVLVGGALLALGGRTYGTPIGTVSGLAGLGLIGWAWLRKTDQ